MRLVRRLTAALAALLLVLPTLAAAQVNPVLTGATRGVDDGDTDSDGFRLDIRELVADVRIAGRTAEVSLELLIGAATDSVPIEARLALTLPDDAVITGYALDVEGRLIPGQLLEQPKARSVYQDEVRKGIDPGLAEVSTRNLFSTRIFPVTADHPRRVRITFVAPFDPAGGFALPLASDRPVGVWRVGMAVVGWREPPAIRFAGAPLALQQSGDEWRGNASGGGTTLAGGIAVSGGTLAAPLTILRHASGRDFFVIADAATETPPPAPAGERLRVYWDRSLSHRSARIDDEIAALDALIATISPAGIDLVTFASDAPQVAVLPDAAALRAALAGVSYRGGTSFAGLDGLDLAEARLCVLVSDGRLTIDNATEFTPDCRLSVLTAAAGADAARLGRLAQRGRGRLVRVDPGKGSAAGAQSLAGGLNPISVRGPEGERLAYRALPAAAGGWLLVGELPQRTRQPDPGALTVRLAGAGGAIVERSYSLTKPSYRSDATAALWAAERVAELGDDPVRHAEMAELARRFQVAGPAMAFLVLETAEQYLAADIAPPDGFSAQWRAAYAEARAVHDKERSAARGERMEFVIGQWEAREDWSRQRFIAKSRSDIQREARRERQDVRAQPLPAPATAPADADVGYAAASADEENIVVTANRLPATASAIALAQRVAGGDAIAATAKIEIDLENVLADRPYLAALDAAPLARRERVLAEQELAYGTVPTFYLDTAEWFRLKGDAATAASLLLSALELDSADDETRQIVAFRLERDRDYDRAVALAELLAAGSEYRPQPRRDLALALVARGKSRGTSGRADLERAFALLVSVVLDPAPVDQGNSFAGLETIALMEANALIPAIEALGGAWSLDRRLVGLIDTDARIVIEWTADDADIDLWVDEPNGERVYYGNQLSSGGGQISNDMTDGYGPEEYAIRRAPAGEYQVRINGFDADRLNPNGPGHVLIRLIRNFGRPDQAEVLVDADLAFQQGRDRDTEAGKKPVAVLKVDR